jgi:hypothetical protein
MKLDWKEFKYVSVVDAPDGCTYEVMAHMGEWRNYKYDGAKCESIGLYRSRDEGKQKIEERVDSHDKPEWHTATDCIAWSKWRGWSLLVCREVGHTNKWTFRAFSATGGDSCIGLTTMADAKKAAEDHVRGRP